MMTMTIGGETSFAASGVGEIRGAGVEMKSMGIEGGTLHGIDTGEMIKRTDGTMIGTIYNI